MRAFRRGSLSIVIAMTGLIVIALFASPAGATQVALDATTFDRIDSFVRQEMADAEIPGVAVAVVVGDQVAHSAGFGVADGSGRAVTPDTPFVLASVSKAFTATAVLQLVEAGQVDLDAPVQRYLPWFRVADEQASAQITVRQLLHHTAGLSPMVAADEHDDGALDRFVHGLAQTPLVSAPGAEHHYTDAAYNILALIVQSVSGEPYDRYLGAHIFGPLGMTHSHALVEDARADGASEGFYRWFGLTASPTRVPVPRGQVGSAGIYSSANDMANWLIAHLNGGANGAGRVLSPQSMALEHTPAVETDPLHGYAMGWVVRPLWEEVNPASNAETTRFELPALIEHGGRSAVGHTYVGFVPERGWAFVMLMNINDMTVESRYMHVEQGIQAILGGREPEAAQTYEEPLIRYGKQLAMVLIVLELISLVWALGRIRRWRKRELVPRGSLQRSSVLVAPLLLDVLVLYLFFVAAPAALGEPLDLLSPYSPDLAFVLWPALILAGMWGPIRTLVFLFLFLRSRPEPTTTTP